MTVLRSTRPDLIGWKAIAAHLAVSVRTAKALKGLPTYDYLGGGFVVAYSEEIDAYVVSTVRARGA